jgi:hypothetical protein
LFFWVIPCLLSDTKTFNKLLVLHPIHAEQMTKTECCNHAVKVTRNRIEEQKKLLPWLGNKSGGGLTAYVCQMLTVNYRAAISQHAKEAAKDDPENMQQHKDALRKKILCVPLHVFGHHESCTPDFCRAARAKQETIQQTTAAKPKPKSKPKPKKGKGKERACASSGGGGVEASRSSCGSSSGGATGSGVGSCGRSDGDRGCGGGPSDTTVNDADDADDADDLFLLVSCEDVESQPLTPTGTATQTEELDELILEEHEEPWKRAGLTQKPKMDERVKTACYKANSYLIEHLDGIIWGWTSNHAEGFFGMLNRFNGGKVLNRMQRGDLALRAHAAVIHINAYRKEGKGFEEVAIPTILKGEPGDFLVKHGAARSKEHRGRAILKQKPEAKQARSKKKRAKTVSGKAAEGDAHSQGSHQVERPEDKSPTLLLHACAKFYKLIVCVDSQAEADAMALATANQSVDPSSDDAKKWMQVRGMRVNASSIKSVISARWGDGKNWDNNLKSRSSTTDLGTVPAIAFGNTNEDHAVERLVAYIRSQTGVESVTCRRDGCRIRPTAPHIAASVDAIVVVCYTGGKKEELTVEMKCSFVAKTEGVSSVSNLLAWYEGKAGTLKNGDTAATQWCLERGSGGTDGLRLKNFKPQVLVASTNATLRTWETRGLFRSLDRRRVCKNWRCGVCQSVRRKGLL